MGGRKKTGYVYDADMLRHENPWDPDHIECPDRLRVSHQRCLELGLLDECERIPSRRAGDEELLLAHSEEHIQNVKTLGSKTIEEIKLATLAKSVFMNEHSFDSARLAAAAAIDLVTAVCEGRVRNGFGLVRPPGHHATKNDLCGFSLFNSVAIAARHTLSNLNVAKVLIVDFDVHHGQGTQYEFYDDPRVLYASIHRHDYGKYWPHLRESDFDHVGLDAGKGFNLNIPLNSKDLEDADYLAIFHQGRNQQSNLPNS